MTQVPTVDNSQQQPPTQGLTVEDVKAMMAGMTDAILEQVDNRFRASATPTPSDSTPPAGDNNATGGTLSQRLKQLEDELARRDKEKADREYQDRYNTSFKTELTRFDLAYPEETMDLLRGVFAGQVQEVEGRWLAKDGKTLSQVIDGFMATPFGQHLIKAPTNQNGSGTTSSNPPRNAAQPVSDLARIFGLA